MSNIRPFKKVGGSNPLYLFFLMLFGGLILYFGSQSLTFISRASLPGERTIKYYGVDRGNPITDANYAQLAKQNVNTIVVDTDILGKDTPWSSITNLASKYKFNVVIWPSDWVNSKTNWPNCGWETPYVKNNPSDYIVKVKPLLDYFYNSANWPDGQVRLVGMVTAHEPMWTCISTIKEMSDIRTQLKDYVKNKFGRNIQAWNYVDNVTDLKNISDYTGVSDIGKIMDVAVTWQHCFGSAEGTCGNAMTKINNDRNAINSAGLNGVVDLVFLFQTFSMGSSSSPDSYYRMPTATEMKQWSCDFLKTGALDGFMYYSWGACWYSSDLYCPASTKPNATLWPVMNEIYNECVMGTTTPTITPTSFPSVTSTPTPTVTPSVTVTTTPTPTPSSVTLTPTVTKVITPTPSLPIASYLPIADAAVFASYPNANFGKYTKLAAVLRPSVSSYLLFKLESLQGKTITKALLRLYVTGSAGSGTTQKLYSAKDNNWTEELINYNSKPSIDTEIGSIHGSNNNRYVDFVITNYVRNKLGSYITLVVTNQSTDRIDFASREDTSHTPKLIIY